MPQIHLRAEPTVLTGADGLFRRPRRFEALTSAIRKWAGLDGLSISPQRCSCRRLRRCGVWTWMRLLQRRKHGSVRRRTWSGP